MSESTSPQADRPTSSRKAKDAADQPFAGIQPGRRRRRSASAEDRAARAAALQAQAEQVAEAGFLGNTGPGVTQVSSPGEASNAPVQTAVESQGTVVALPSAPAQQADAPTEVTPASPSQASIPAPGTAPETLRSPKQTDPSSAQMASSDSPVPQDQDDSGRSEDTSATDERPFTDAALARTAAEEASTQRPGQADQVREGSGSEPVLQEPADEGEAPSSPQAASPGKVPAGRTGPSGRRDSSTGTNAEAQRGNPRRARRSSATPRSSSRSTTRHDGVAEEEMAPCHRLVHESFEDSRTNSQTWETIGANMIPPIWSALREQIAADRRSSGNRELANGHYMNIVLRSAPLDMDEIYTLYEELSRKFRGQLPSGRKTTLRVSAEAAAKHYEVKELCDEADFARRGLFVHSALMLRFLTQLREAGPLPRLELPPLF